MKCILSPEKRKVKKKPTAVSLEIEMSESLHRSVETEETMKEQQQRIARYMKKGDQQFTVQGRTAEILVELVLQARAKIQENKASGPENDMVSEIIKQ